MKVKTYVFEDVKKGIEILKEEFGPDTIIMDVKDNGKNGSRKNCEISVAVKDAEPSRADDPADLRKKTETIWDYTTRLFVEKMAGLESEIIRDRIKSYPLPLRILFEKMVKNGFDLRLAVSIVSEVYGGIGNLAEESGKASFFLKDIITEKVKINDVADSDDSILMLGPTGAGKTQTTKKLAKLLYSRGKHVSIVVYDPVRRGNCDELASFGENSGIPFSFTTSEDDLCFMIAKDKGKKIVDLTGHVTYQKRVAERLTDVRKVILLPAGARDDKMRNYCKQFEDLSIAGLIFTKLDEEETLGHICHNLILLEKSLCGLTTGADMGDLVLPTHEMFYKILLEGNVWNTREKRLLQ